MHKAVNYLSSDIPHLLICITQKGESNMQEIIKNCIEGLRGDLGAYLRLLDEHLAANESKEAEYFTKKAIATQKMIDWLLRHQYED